MPYYLYSIENQSFGILHHNKDLEKYDKSFKLIENLIIVQIKQMYSLHTTRCNYLSKTTTTQLAFHVKAIHTR